MVDGLLGQPLVNDLGEQLLPPQRAYWFPNGEMNEPALLTFWAVSIVPTANGSDNEASVQAALDEARPLLTAARAFWPAQRLVEQAEQDARFTAQVLTERQAARRQALAERRSALAELLLIGLRDRLGLQLLGLHRDAYVWLRERAAAPHGLAVCERCWLVLESKRSDTRTCRKCSHSPKRVPPLTVKRDPDGIDTISLISGAIVRSRQCQVCGASFDLENRQKRECDNTCKQRRKDRVAAGHPIRDARSSTWIDMSWDFSGLRTAICTNTACGAEYGTVEPGDARCPRCEDEAAGHLLHRPWEGGGEEGWRGATSPGRSE